MKVLLRHNVDKLGDRGEVVNVKRGFARNYLLPTGLAMNATPGAVKQFEFERKRLEREENERMAVIQKQLDQLAKFELTLTMKANAEGHLFGSVNEHTLAHELQAAGFQVQVRHLRIEQPIKELGVYQIPVVLDSQHRAEVKLWVVEEKAKFVATGDEISLDEPRS